VEAHPYAATDLWRVIENALLAAGKDPRNLTSADTASFDHFHTGGIDASLDLLELALTTEPHDVLDLGAGVGGASRFLAEHTKASIVSLDFEREFCAVNARLTSLLGYSGRIRVLVGDATEIPFRSASFDWVWMQQAAMNIADKARLHAELVRVLRPGGCFVFQEILAGSDPGPLQLPTAWAAVQADSHLEPPEEMRARLHGLGLDEVAFEDVTDRLLPGLRARFEAARADGAPTLGVHLLSTSDLTSILEGMLRSTEMGRLRFVRGVYQASWPGLL